MPTPQQRLIAVCTVFQVTEQDMHGQSQRDYIVEARQAYWLMNQEDGGLIPRRQIAFLRRRYTRENIGHGIRTAKKIASVDTDYRDKIEQIRNLLTQEKPR